MDNLSEDHFSNNFSDDCFSNEDFNGEIRLPEGIVPLFQQMSMNERKQVVVIDASQFSKPYFKEKSKDCLKDLHPLHPAYCIDDIDIEKLINSCCRYLHFTNGIYLTNYLNDELKHISSFFHKAYGLDRMLIYSRYFSIYISGKEVYKILGEKMEDKVFDFYNHYSLILDRLYRETCSFNETFNEEANKFVSEVPCLNNVPLKAHVSATYLYFDREIEIDYQSRHLIRIINMDRKSKIDFQSLKQTVNQVLWDKLRRGYLNPNSIQAKKRLMEIFLKNGEKEDLYRILNESFTHQAKEYRLKLINKLKRLQQRSI